MLGVQLVRRNAYTTGMDQLIPTLEIQYPNFSLHILALYMFHYLSTFSISQFTADFLIQR